MKALTLCTCLAAAVTGLAWFQSADPQPLQGLTPDFFEGNQTTYDVTDQVKDAQELERAMPGIFTPSSLTNSTSYPSVYSIAYAALEGGATQGSQKHNALLPVEKALATKKLYHWRFVEVPGSNPVGSFALGISSKDAYGTQWSSRGVFLGHQGNLQAQGGLLYSQFTQGHGVGDFVDWFMEIYDTSVEIYVAVNEIAYGHAFHLDFKKNTTIIPTLRPTVSFNEESNDTAVCLVAFTPVKIPTDAPYKSRSTGPKGTGINGHWYLHHPRMPTPVTANIETKKGETMIAMRVRNSFHVRITLDPTTGEVLKKGHAVSTRMAVQGDNAISENMVFELLSELKNVKSVSDQQVQMTRDDGRLYQFLRNKAVIDAQTENPFIHTA